jgi:trimeric autotransporter adhesin
MRDAGRRPGGRLCYWMMWLTAVFVMQAASGAAFAQSGPATTTVTDTVYNATGALANGTMIITWPAFTTASGTQVADGSTNATITSGVFSVALVPNAGATPAGVYYSVVYQLGPLPRCTWTTLSDYFL